VQRLPGNGSPLMFHLASTAPMIFTSTPALMRSLMIRSIASSHTCGS
jgi:hypothetical protein